MTDSRTGWDQSQAPREVTSAVQKTRYFGVLCKNMGKMTDSRTGLGSVAGCPARGDERGAENQKFWIS
jgi:hypothetical protein